MKKTEREEVKKGTRTAGQVTWSHSGHCEPHGPLTPSTSPWPSLGPGKMAKAASEVWSACSEVHLE